MGMPHPSVAGPNFLHVFGNMHRRADLRRRLDIAEAVEAVRLATVPHRAKVRAGFTVE